MGKFTVISIALFLFTGCAITYKVQTPTGERNLPIDEALLYVNNEESAKKIYRQWRKMYSYSGYLANYEEEGNRINRKLKGLQNKQDLEFQHRRMIEENKKNELAKIEREQEAIRECERLKKEWAEFIQSCDGSLRNKTAQEVKKLVDQYNKDKWHECKEEGDYSLENFHKVFGKPLKTQFISGSVSMGGRYYLWYTCKDGNAQITVDAYALDEKGRVVILDLSIF